MIQDLEEMGFTVVPFGQGYTSMSPPTKVCYKLLMEGRIQQGRKSDNALDGRKH